MIPKWVNLPKEIWTSILEYCDGPTLDSTVTVSRQFTEFTNEARINQVEQLRLRADRFTNEALPSRLELLAMRIPHPNFANILRTMAPQLQTQEAQKGPLQINVEAHALLQRQQRSGVVVSRPSLQGGFDDIGQTNGEGQTHGFGVRNFIDGQEYHGLFNNGRPHGLGYEVYGNGNRYEGNFENGLHHGQGKLTLANGASYEGQLVEGRFPDNSHGKLTYPGGSIYEGQFENGKPHGQGKLTYANGDVYEGQFKNGKRNGPSIQ